MKPLEGEFPNKTKPNQIQRFFMLCSGANQGILDQCPTEWNKYSGIGATIFFTGLLASLSGGYALYTIFRATEFALAFSILFGVIWGFIILNLDRFVVSSIRKEGDFRKEMYQATPRLILAIIISIVIAKPIEVRLFESRIEQQILEDKRKKLEHEKLSVDKLNDLTKLANSIADQNAELGALDSLKQGDPTNDDFRNLVIDRNAASRDLSSVSRANNPRILQYNIRIAEIRNDPTSMRYKTDSTGTHPNGLTAEAKKVINDLSYSRNILQNEIKAKQKRVDDLDAEVSKARNDYKALMAQRISDKEAEIQQTKEAKERADAIARKQFDESAEVKQRSYTNNFITQLEAIGNLTDSNSTMAWTSFMIMLLFIVMETAPIVVKLLSKRGPYDEILERVEYEHYINEKQLISNWNSKINELLDKAKEAAKLEGEVFIQVEKQRLDFELKNNHRILEDLAIKQESLAKIAVDEWYKAELAKSLPQQPLATSAKGTRLENNFWKEINTMTGKEYYFRNGSRNNELLYHENHLWVTGRWHFISPNNDEIRIEVGSSSVDYLITELSDTTLKFKDKITSDLIVFEKL